MDSKAIGKILVALSPPIAALAEQLPEHYGPYVAFAAACLAAVGGVLGWSAPADAAELQAARDANAPRAEKRYL